MGVCDAFFSYNSGAVRCLRECYDRRFRKCAGNGSSRTSAAGRGSSGMADVRRRSGDAGLVYQLLLVFDAVGRESGVADDHGGDGRGYSFYHAARK